MILSDGAEIVAMAVLPAGVAPQGGEEEEEEAAAAADDGEGEEEEDESVVVGGGGDAEAGAGDSGPHLLLVTAQGQGKRVRVSDFRVKTGRVGQGVRAINLKAGDRLAAMQLVGAPGGAAAAAADSGSDAEGAAAPPAAGDVLLSTHQGQLVRVPVGPIRVMGPTAKGTRLVRVRDGDEVVAATLLAR
jgi:DNA gyrase subunit A